MITQENMYYSKYNRKINSIDVNLLIVYSKNKHFDS